ncbi:MAG: ADP-glyceromanno-heptose 6-epimerase [Magnetococcales bacterium]|nr:ADP-glyceromanno-heptose 6-epimerase [Magnetococcales bacterium]
MFIVTGGAGFIGANVVDGLNQQGETDILVVDNLKNATKFRNLTDLKFADFMDKTEFMENLKSGVFNNHPVEAIFHQGACSDTMEYDGRYMMENNFTYSKVLFHYAASKKTPFIYASSAATYGASSTFVEHPDNEGPLNVYGYSKLLFDRYVERILDQVESPVAGMRYFNVYGPREIHKGKMTSMVNQLHDQIRDKGEAKLFEGTGGYGPGEQRRDFIHVGDVVKINLFLASAPLKQGIFNVGTGQSRSFNDIANSVIQLLGKGKITYKEMPEVLKDKYQSFTEADITRLKNVGYDQPFATLEAGIAATMEARKKLEG